MPRHRVLIVEDSMLIVTLLEEVFALLDFDIVGPAGTVSDALQLAREARFDIAVLDINLHDELVFPIADVLVERHIPFFFSSGYSATTVLPERFADMQLLPKPYHIEALIDAIAQTVARVGNGNGGVGAKAGGS